MAIKIQTPKVNEMVVKSVTVFDGSDAVASLQDGEDMRSWRDTLTAKEAAKLDFLVDTSEGDIMIKNVRKVKPLGRGAFSIHTEGGDRYKFFHTSMAL
jgi:hypothetical protein